MALDLQLEALTVPDGTQFPGTVQGLLDLIAEYVAILGQSDFSGVAYGSSEPAPESQGLAWWKTSDAGDLLGWFGWNGSAWVAAPLILPNGPTASRPSDAVLGQLYFDTDIDVQLIYNGAAWITQAGSPGDVKFVKAATLADALAKNPGWSQDEDSMNRVIVGASDGTGAGEREYGDTWGEDEHTLTLSELPNDTIDLQDGWGIFPGQFQNGPQAPGISPICTGLTTEPTGPINPGTQEAFNLSPRSIAYWCLTKD